MVHNIERLISKFNCLRRAESEKKRKKDEALKLQFVSTLKAIFSVFPNFYKFAFTNTFISANNLSQITQAIFLFIVTEALKDFHGDHHEKFVEEHHVI